MDPLKVPETPKITFDSDSYIRFIQDKFLIVNKLGVEVPFMLNNAQVDFIKQITGRDIILKARQLGFSSLILAIMTARFILRQNERLVCISHEHQATQRLLDRVKYYISTYEKRNIKIPLTYNSRNEISFAHSNNTFYIGTAGSKTFGRGDTISVLHLSEAAHFPNIQDVLSSSVQAVVPTGFVFMETTANGFNEFKNFWDSSKLEETGYKTHFYDPRWEYSDEFLEGKKRELKNTYLQEYPSTDIEAFINSGNGYFSREALNYYLLNVKDPIITNTLYV